MSRAEISAWVRHKSKEDARLYELYGKPLEDDHHGRYVAISEDGGTILGDDPDSVLSQAIEAFGSGNFALTRVGNEAFGQWLQFAG
jgi:hypothetical protein